MTSDGVVPSPIPEGITCPMVHADRLRTYWQSGTHLTILDTALNAAQTLLSVWFVLREQASVDKPLHIIAMTQVLPDTSDIMRHASVEQYPLAQMLCAALPPAIPGHHRILLDGGKVIVTLVIGDYMTSLPLLQARVDVFYLKPSLFASTTTHTMKRLGQLANMDARLWAMATNIDLPAMLQAGGFVVKECEASASGRVMAQFAPRWHVNRPVVATGGHQAIVIGAGLAGAAVAERLTARGWHVTMLEAASGPAQGASGNLAGIYMPMISQDDNPASRFMRAAYLYGLQRWEQLGGIGDAIQGEACGVLQVARNVEQDDAFMRSSHKWQYPASYARYMNSAQASQALGTSVLGGWLFPQAGWLRPSSVCAAMLAAGQRHTGQLDIRYDCRATSIVHEDGHWTVYDDHEQIVGNAPVLILAHGQADLQLTQTDPLPLTPIRGQVSHLHASDVPVLPYVVCGDGYLTRPYDGLVSLGATYETPTGEGVTRDGHSQNLEKLHAMLPAVSVTVDMDGLHGRVGLRSVTPDRLPLIGAMPLKLAQIAHGVADKGLGAVPRISGLYGALGFASRGLILAPLAAEILACELNGEPLPVGMDLRDAVDPARFILRQLRQTKGN
jgi:tRNA 5-methylaminomethyl-2-thiouridine biosynthesis bifunctional protein